ncbi:MAG: hypothetical protein RMM53_08530, partial [Bacteroidia bacterium]|nr:hypothetical protein [Bacteroidia bacterium]
GLPPGPYCQDKILDVFVVETRQKCEHRKPFWVSEDGATSYCMECLPDSGAVKKVFEYWPPEWVAYFEREGVRRDLPPPHNPRCSGLGNSQTRIVFPTHGSEIFISDARKVLTAQAHADVRARKLHWFVNDRYAGASAHGDSPPLRPASGKVKITVRDDLGGKHSVEFAVKFSSARSD